VNEIIIIEDGSDGEIFIDSEVVEEKTGVCEVAGEDGIETGPDDVIADGKAGECADEDALEGLVAAVEKIGDGSDSELVVEAAEEKMKEWKIAVEDSFRGKCS
jgi:hypothetical protein